MLNTNFGTQIRTTGFSGPSALHAKASSVAKEAESPLTDSAPGLDIAQFSTGAYQGFSGTSMAMPSVAGIATLLSAKFKDKEEYVPQTAGSVTSEVENQVGAKLEESRAYSRLATELGEKFSVDIKHLERVSVAKDEFPTRDMGLYDGGFGDISTSTRARSVLMRSETHNFLLREGLDVDKSTLAVWGRGNSMPDVWERDMERGTLFAAGMPPVQPSPRSERRTGILA